MRELIVFLFTLYVTIAVCVAVVGTWSAWRNRKVQGYATSGRRLLLFIAAGIILGAVWIIPAMGVPSGWVHDWWEGLKS